MALARARVKMSGHIRIADLVAVACFVIAALVVGLAGLALGLPAPIAGLFALAVFGVAVLFLAVRR